MEKKSELKKKAQEKNLRIWKKITERTKLKTLAKKPPKSRKSPSKLKQKLQKIINQEPNMGALNPNSVLCTDQAPLPAFSALNPGSTLQIPKSRD